MTIAVYHNLPSGGARHALFAMLRQLHPHHQIDVYSLYEDRDELWPLNANCRQVYSYRAKPPRETVTTKLQWRRQLRELDTVQRQIAHDIDSRTYDLVFVHNCTHTQSPLILQHLRTPAVFYTQEPRRVDYEFRLQQAQRQSGVRGRLLRQREAAIQALDQAAIRAATTVLCNSYYSLESLKRAYGVDAQVCYLGVKADSFPLAKAAPADYVLCVGALEPFKNQLQIVQALALVPAARRPKLVVVADRSDAVYATTVTQAAAASGVELDLRQRISAAELAHVYGQALATICVADLEPFGFTPLESMACGTPVIAQQEGGYRETTTAELGHLLTDRDPRTLAAAIELVPKLARGSALRAYVQKQWSWQRTATQLDTIFTQVSRGR